MSPYNKIIKIEDLLGFKDLSEYTIIDVRSPSEFLEDHIPDAVTKPVLNDNERAEVGTIYSQESSFKAKEVGARIISKNISEMLETLSELAKDKKPFLVYCWRGGLRSRSLFTILDLIGYKTFILEGGYKSYRKKVHSILNDEFPILIGDKIIAKQLFSIHGYTGSGKTELLKLLKNGNDPVLDLEKAAEHRGSFLGSFRNQKQPSQKMFESTLLETFVKNPSEWYAIEGESRKIGRVTIPTGLWNAMQKGKKIWVELPLAFRVKLSVESYGDDIIHLQDKIKFLEEPLGKKRIEEINILLKKDCLFEAAEILLAEYYDPMYRKHAPEMKPERYSKIIHALDLNDLYEKTKKYLQTETG